MNSIQFLDCIREMHTIPSDNQLSKYLGVSQPTIAQIRTGKRKIDDALALSVAKSLDISPTYVMASIQAERAKRSDVRRIWANVARQATGRRGLNYLSFVAFGLLSAAHISAIGKSIVCILCKVRSRIQNGLTTVQKNTTYAYAYVIFAVALVIALLDALASLPNCPGPI